jgi:hypothetical protein
MDDVIRTRVEMRERAGSPAWQAYQLLRWTFVIAPTLAGLDKFFHVLTDWDSYLAPAVGRMLPFSAHNFMLLVGVVEIVAGLIVLLTPRIGGYVVAAWLAGIIVNLVLRGGLLDIALRDLGLCLAALALARLSVLYRRPPRTATR